MKRKYKKKWLQYVEPFADNVSVDHSGNAIAAINPDAPFKILLAGHCDEIGFLIKSIDENGYLYVEKLGGISHKPALGMEVQVLGTKGSVSGVIGTNAEHHGGADDKFSIDDLFIDCGASSAQEIKEYVQVGDPAVYQVAPKRLMGECFSARGLDNRTGAFIVAEVLRRLHQKRPDVGVYAVSTVNEETNMGGAYFAGAGLQPDLAIALDVTFATDYPAVSTRKHGDIKIGGGPVLAKGAPINLKANALLEESAKRLNMSIQYELTPRNTGTDADRIRLTGKGVPIALVSLPLRYMHAPREVVSLTDMKQEIELLVDFVQNLSGTEELRPVIWP
ncbi:M20/M25/M40 family metallo-hydrolase [Bacillus sp. JCM 19041]|uniref:M20/M25/M40 family metallo-hydrolase n=1 Tax=Bacillus sp. JCM 19041 TaxID=1460637 RepID=UPI000B118E00